MKNEIRLMEKKYEHKGEQNKLEKDTNSNENKLKDNKQALT